MQHSVGGGHGFVESSGATGQQQQYDTSSSSSLQQHHPPHQQQQQHHRSTTIDEQCCSDAYCGGNKNTFDHFQRYSTAQFSPPIPLRPFVIVTTSSPMPSSSTKMPHESMAAHNSYIRFASVRSSGPTVASSFASSASSTRSVTYVYELPYNVRKAVCDLLDADGRWRELGGSYINFSDTELTLISHALYRNASPTNELLTKWESSNARVEQLFHYLAQMKHRRAMYFLLEHVDHKMRQLYQCFDKESTIPIIDPITEMRNVKVEHNVTPQGEVKSLGARSNPVSHHHINLNQMPFVNQPQQLPPSQLPHPPPPPPNFFQVFHAPSPPSPMIMKNITPIVNSGGMEEEATLVEEQKQLQKENDSIDNRLKISIEDLEIPYKDLNLATNNFASENILGSGGFGTVFMGEWKGTKVAVKKLKGIDNTSQALTELRVLNRCRIDNILPLYAVSLDGPEPCLVYQFMPNGSLEDRLLGKGNTKPLNWAQRSNIGEGIARALNYLHTIKGNPFVHGDVKSANILLDSNFEPKLGDFGLARRLEKNADGNQNSMFTHCTVTSVNGTSVYLPTEYLRNKILSPAVDVYSYGIVMLEMATGKRAFDGKKLLVNSVEDEYCRVLNASAQPRFTNRQISADVSVNIQNQPQQVSKEALHESLMDRRIADQLTDRHWFSCLLELGRKCAHKIKARRPNMNQVLEYYNQCKTTDRINQLSVDACVNQGKPLDPRRPSRTPKTPFELQLWYDFVRESCGTLSDAVFEHFGTQVTKMIEEIKGQSPAYIQPSGGGGSPLQGNHLQPHSPNAINLASPLPMSMSVSVTRPSHISSTPPPPLPPPPPAVTNQAQQLNAGHVMPMRHASTPPIVAGVGNQQPLSCISSASGLNESIHLPDMLRLMSLSSEQSNSSNSTCTVEDELSSSEDVATTPSSASTLTPSTIDDSAPFIPLLTALGFNDETIETITTTTTNTKSDVREHDDNDAARESKQE